ncbi:MULTISPECIES: TetR/AcrR family transcriptional regulator [Brevibacterium]|uniref:TetR/AcrR family transcriptional regulator n=1 Tax=Brevibacterium TaxID=1696 RepID=UPI001C6935CE|nr:MULTISPECIES: TetR/AcrR family transcriptional regulator [Brevibacterium]
MALSSARSIGNRIAIQDAATELFLQRGYAGTSMDDVASAARVSKQTVYKHFANKDELFSRIILETTAQIDHLVDHVAERLRDPEDLPAALRALARRFAEAVLDPDTLRLRRVVIATAERFPELGASWYENGFERVLATLSQRFAELSAGGQLTIDDPDLAAEHFVGLLLWIPVNRAMFTGAVSPVSPGDLDRIIDQGVGAFLRAYASTDRPPVPNQ